MSRVAEAFSPKRNVRALFVRPHDNFAPLDGIRGLFTLWVIAAHCLFAQGIVPFRAAIDARPGLRWAFLAHYAIDAFFVMSGFLLAHVLMKERARTGSIAVGRFLARRALRILPAYYLAIAACALFAPENRDTLLYNVLYVNNFLPALRQFMLWTWSLAVEEHFYLALPFLLLGLYRTRYFRGPFLVGLFVLAAFVRLILVDAGGFGVPIVDPLRQSLPILDALYTKTYSRFGSLVCGVFVAYLWHERPELLRGIEGSPRLSAGLAAGSLLCIGVLFAPSAPTDIPYFQFGNTWPDWLLPAGVALNRYLFAVAFSVLLLLMLGSSRLGRWLGAPLALRVWYPFAQLSYAAYLFHPLVIRNLPRPGSLDYAALAWIFVEACVLTYALAFAVHLAVERPCMNLRAPAATPRAPDGTPRPSLQ